MLNKLNALNYLFNDNREITQVTLGFSDYTTDVRGNLSVVLNNEDGDLNNQSPAQLQEMARDKAIEELSKVEESPKVEEVE